MAVHGVIYVYRPCYPDQKTGVRRIAELESEPSIEGQEINGNFRGRGSDDNAINNMLVAELGTKEIVLCARDNGDITAWWTEPLSDFTGGSWPMPFFKVNVGASAWGLSVHSRARMIAVSSNSFNVDVFAFALQSEASSSTSTSSDGQADDQQDLDDLDIQPDWEVYESSPGADTIQCFSSRERNIRIVLRGHNANIPSLGFCNADEDSEGRFLMSSDIGGDTIIWNVERALLYRRMSLAPDLTELVEPKLFLWGSQWIDKRAFLNSGVDEIFTGACHRPFPEHYSYLINISGGKSAVRHNGPWTSEELDSEGSDDDLISQTSENSDNDFWRGQPGRSRQHSGMYSVPGQARRPLLSLEKMQGLQWPWTCPMPSTTQHVPERGIEVPEIPPDSPLIVVSASGVNLFQSWNTYEMGADAPLIHLNEPLEQEVMVQMQARMNHFDRMNLNVAIPELGVLLLGSPKGRVAVMTLHQLESSPFTKNPKAKPMYAMRLDHILPLRSQERATFRPAVELAGVAAGPIQGRNQGVRRWRIMLTYRDHSVISYEVGWRAQGIGGDVLVV